MQDTSAAFQAAIISNNRQLFDRATLQTLDETEYELGPSDIVGGSLSVRSSCFDDGIELGAILAGDCSLTLDNADGRWNDVQLDGAILKPYSGVVLPDSSIEEVLLGTFIIDEPGWPYSQLSIQASDRLILLDEPFSNVTMAFPATNLQILQAITTYCGVPLSSSVTSARNIDYSATERPTDDLSCRDIVGMIGMMAAGFVRMTRLGELEIVSFPALISNNNVDGNGTDTYMLDGTCTDDLYEIGGADFTDVFGYQGDVIEMGIGSRYFFKQTGEPVIVSGIQYNAPDETLIIGADNYLVVIESCPLIQADSSTVLQSIYEAIVGFTYTGFASDYPGNPAIDLGDAVRHLTMDGKEIVSLISSHYFVHGKPSTMEATAKSAKEKKYKGATARQLTTLTDKANAAQAAIDEIAPISEGGQRLIELAKLGDTVVEGGYIKTGLVNASNIISGKMESADGNTYFDLDADKIVTSAEFTSTKGTGTQKTTLANGGILSERFTPMIAGGTVLDEASVLAEMYLKDSDGNPSYNLLNIVAYYTVDIDGSVIRKEVYFGDHSPSSFGPAVADFLLNFGYNSMKFTSAGMRHTHYKSSTGKYYSYGIDDGGFYTIFDGTKTYRYPI